METISRYVGISRNRLLDKIAWYESVIDVGCGYNLFKGKIHNLTGIDPPTMRQILKQG